MRSVYAHTRFDIGVFAWIAGDGMGGKGGARDADETAETGKIGGRVQKLACVKVQPLPERREEARAWFAGWIGEVRGKRGVVRASGFEGVGGVVREGSVVSAKEGGVWLALVEFGNGVSEEVDGLGGLGGERDGVARCEVEWYRVKRVWGEGEGEEVGMGL